MFAPRLVVLLSLLAASACGGARKPDAKTGPPAETGSGDTADCHERKDGPTRPDCESLVAHLAGVMPEDVSPDNAQDVCDCLAMPAPLIACLQKIDSRDQADACVDEYVPGAAATGAQARKDAPTREACERAVAHLASLDAALAADIAGDEADFVEDCMGEASAAEVDCVIAAATLEEAERCDS